MGESYPREDGLFQTTDMLPADLPSDKGHGGGVGRRIVLAGGGTAGHVNPLLAVADAIKAFEPKALITVIGTESGLEGRLVPQAGYRLETIEKVTFPRRLNATSLRFPLGWRRETGKVRGILQQSQAQIVAGFGGYASAPVYWVAHRMGLPLAIHEQNARAGMANRLGSHWASFVGTAYDHTGLKAPKGWMERIGLPLRPAIAQLCRQVQANRQLVRHQAALRLGLDPLRPVTVVTGGSLGAVSLNEAVAAASPQLLEKTQLIHLTGRGKIEQVRKLVTRYDGSAALNDLDPAHGGRGDYHLTQYLESIELAFACADLVICRAGAGTVSELTALGLPAIYVPLPIGNGEQRFNAQPVVQAGGGLLVSDAQFTREWVLEHVPGILDDQERLDAMGRSAWAYGIRDAAQVMAGRILDLDGLRSMIPRS